MLKNFHAQIIWDKNLYIDPVTQTLVGWALGLELGFETLNRSPSLTKVDPWSQNSS